MKRHILVVDDENEHRKIASLLLTQADAVAIAVSNGSDALDKLRNMEIDGIISDIYMPRMNGIELMLEIRKLEVAEERRAIPILLISSSPRSASADKITASFGVNFIMKPLSFDVVRNFLIDVVMSQMKAQTH